MVVIEKPVYGIDGVKDQVLDKIYEMLVQGRRYFGSAGASLTQHANNPDYDSGFKAKLVTSGLEGERSTSKLLRSWAENKENIVIVDSAHIRGMGTEEIDEDGNIEGGDTDHILIMGSMVVLIDTKRWKSKRKYSIAANGKVLRSDKHFPGGNVHAYQAMYMWKKYLYGTVKIKSLVCINAEKVFVKMDKHWKKQPYRLITKEHLLDNLDYMYERLREDEKSLDTTIVAQIAVCAIKPFDSYTRVFDMDQIKDVK